MDERKTEVGFRLWIRCRGCGSDMDNKAHRSLNHSILKGRLDSGIDDRRKLYDMCLLWKRGKRN